MPGTDESSYDEFAYLSDNAAEYGLDYAGCPPVRRVDVAVAPGRRVSALIWGDRDPELVLLHGASQNAHTWDTVALALRPRALLAVDLPGHGHSDRARDRGSPTVAAADVAAVVSALAPSARAVVGMSFGGLTGIALTQLAPEVVRKLVLVDVVPGLRAERARHILDFVNGPRTFKTLDEMVERAVRFNPSRAEASLRRGVRHNALQLEDGAWVWRHARWGSSGDSQGNAPHVAAYAGEPRFQDLIEPLRQVRVPVLLARGMKPDSVLREDDEARFRQVVPEGQVLRFTNAGHSIQGDMPLALARAIARFSDTGTTA